MSAVIKGRGRDGAQKTFNISFGGYSAFMTRWSGAKDTVVPPVAEESACSHSRYR
jgi:hypothetical protein